MTICGYGVISTHTLTWSVTKTEIHIANEINISTHTLTWSVTVAKSSIKGITITSTHTLTWSVTLSVLIKR